MHNNLVIGKGNLIECIRDDDTELTGDFVRISGKDQYFFEIAQYFADEFAKGELEKCILRSDANCEDYMEIDKNDEVRKIVTYAGMFDSIRLNEHDIRKARDLIFNPHSLAARDEVLLKTIWDALVKNMKNVSQEDNRFFQLLSEQKSRLDDVIQAIKEGGLNNNNNNNGTVLKSLIKRFGNREINIPPKAIAKAIEIEQYSRFRGIDITQSRMDFILHRFYEGDEVLVVEHPNIPDFLHIEKKIGTIWKRYNGHVDELSRLPEELRDFAQDYVNTLYGLRKKGVIRNDVVYVAEGVIMKEKKQGQKRTKMVQLRPVRKKQTALHPNPRIVGTIPDSGIELHYDESTGKYDGLEVINNLTGLHSDNSRLPRDVTQGRQIKIMMFQEGHNCYLSHSGLRNLENITTLDNSQTALESYEAIKGARVIRYFERPDGRRAFEVVRK